MDDDSSAHMNPEARSPVLVVAHTPGIPARYEVLLKNISCLLSWENQGKSYQCSSNQKNEFLRWSKADRCLFFEWEEEEERMVCWMHDILGDSHIKFLVNPVIKHGINDATVKHPALAFSAGFGDGPWAIVKIMLSTIFGSSQENDSVEHDHMYVFTRIDSSFCIRNYKIDAIPGVNDTASPLVLTETNPFFCFKLLDAQGVENQVPGMLENKLYRTVVYGAPIDRPGSYTPHSVKLDNRPFQILLNNDCNISLVGEYDGFNLSLDHLLSKEPSLKIKPIFGSLTNKQAIFVRNRFKFILRSAVLELQELFASKKCLEAEDKILSWSHVLIRGTNVKFYGISSTQYTDKLAKHNLFCLAGLIRSCFPSSMIPVEVMDATARLLESEEDPINSLEELKNDCLWLRADERRTLIITHHSEFMTNFDIQAEGPDDEEHYESKSVQMKEIFYSDCPYIESWKQDAMDNEYLMQVTNMPADAIKDSVADPIEDSVGCAEASGADAVEDSVGCAESSVADAMGTEGRKRDAKEGREDTSLRLLKKKLERAQKKLRKSSSKSMKKIQKRRERNSKGKIQFDSMRNCSMHMPEKAQKDGICPFRLGIADYTLTAYYRKYLAFVHRRISLLIKKRRLEKMNERQ